MALTAFQLELLRLVSVRGDRALFQDTVEAVDVSFEVDRSLLLEQGYLVQEQRRHRGFVEALVRRGGDGVVVQWAADSAFRFFPLVEHEDFGLVLHPFDLATNKVLALVGRLEVRDWLDLIACHASIQRVGYLVWAAAGKDPGFGPTAILEQAARSARYTSAEIATLAFDGPPPDAVDTSRRWHEMLDEAQELVRTLPPSETGRCVIDAQGVLFRGGLPELRKALAADGVRFHAGSIRGALPRVRPT